LGRSAGQCRSRPGPVLIVKGGGRLIKIEREREREREREMDLRGDGWRERRERKGELDDSTVQEIRRR
jgi:hypothetical protein